MNLKPRIVTNKSFLTSSEYQSHVNGFATMTKYKAIPVEIDGHRFASKLESRRYKELKLMRGQGLIRSFKMQVKFPLLEKIPGKFNEKYYVADFVVYHNDGSVIVEDTKGIPTALYKLKKHLFYIKYKMEIREIYGK